MDVTIPAPSLDCQGCQKLTKCCAFQPFIPNFLLGGYLKDAYNLPQISNVDFYPVGAVPSSSYRENHLKTQNHGVEFICGFFSKETRTCKIWNYRPGECSSYFCDDGGTSPKRKANSEKSFTIEVAVAQMALAQLGFSPTEISAQVDAINGKGTESHKYPGADLLIMYKKAWDWSQTLDKNTIENWLGIG